MTEILECAKDLDIREVRFLNLVTKMALETKLAILMKKLVILESYFGFYLRSKMTKIVETDQFW